MNIEELKKDLESLMIQEEESVDWNNITDSHRSYVIGRLEILEEIIEMLDT